MKLQRGRFVWRKALFFILLCLMLACRGESSPQEVAKRQGPRVAIIFTEPHPVLNSIIDAFKASVQRGIPHAVFTERHGSGSKAQYPAVIRAALAERPALLVTITTPISIEGLKQARGNTPLLFLGVTDPIGAELVSDLARPELSSGVSDNPPMGGVVSLVTTFYPTATKIGVPYDPKDQPAVTTAQRTAELARSKGLKAELLPITSEAEIRAAVRVLASRNDALVIGMDNLFMKNAGITARTAMEVTKPLFAADDKSVEMGALAGVGVNYSDVGRIGGEMAVKVLRDKVKIGEIPVATLETGDIFFNLATARSLGITVPADVSAKGRPVSQR